MMKTILYFLLFSPIIVIAQTEETMIIEIDSISTVDEANEFIKLNRSLKGKIYTFNKEKHKTTLASELFALNNGGKKSYKHSDGTTYYKVIDKNEVLHYRVSIILFDSNTKTDAEINALQSSIIASYKGGGKNFEYFAKVYSSGRSSKTGGDLGWLKNGEQSEAFEESVNRHTKGDIYSFKDSKSKKQYIILKTEDWTPIEELTVLKVKETNNR